MTKKHEKSDDESDVNHEIEELQFQLQRESPLDNPVNYTNMAIRESMWSRTGSYLRSIAGFVIVFLCCLGVALAVAGMRGGWDRLFAILGWK